MKITPQMLVDRHGLIDVDSLAQLEGNPHRADEQALASSIDTFGQFEPIVVWNGEILIGNHRAAHFASKGVKQIAGYDLSDIDLDEAHRLSMALASNRIAQLGTDDPRLLAEAINTIADSNIGLVDSAGFDLEALPAELGGLVEVGGYLRGVPDFSPEDEGSQPRLDEQPEIVCPNCNHSFVL